MSSVRVVIRVGAVVVGLAGLALTVPTMAASNKEADAGVEIDELDEAVTAGGEPAALTVSIAKSTNGCTRPSNLVAVRLDGLTPAAIRIERRLSGLWVRLPVALAGADTVQTTDLLADGKLCEGDTRTVRYRVRFLDDAPTGDARFTVEAYTVSGKELGSDTATSQVTGGAAPPPDQPAPLPDDATPLKEPAAPAPPPVAETTGPAAETPDARDPTTAAAVPVPPAATDEPAPPVAGAAAEPPAASRESQETDRLSSTVTVGGASLAAVGLLLLGVLGWRFWRRRGGEPAPAAGAEPTTDSVPLILPAGTTMAPADRDLRELFGKP